MENNYCHELYITHHIKKCLDSSECWYGQQDGPDDYINECECYYGEKE